MNVTAVDKIIKIVNIFNYIIRVCVVFFLMFLMIKMLYTEINKLDNYKKEVENRTIKEYRIEQF